MIDPLSIGLGLAAANFVIQASGRLGEEAAEGVAQAIRDFVSWLRTESAADPKQQKALSQLEEVPDSPSRLERLAAAIDARAEEDPRFRDRLRDAVAEVRNHEPSGVITEQSITGSGNVQAAHVSGQVHVSYGDRGPVSGNDA